MRAEIASVEDLLHQLYLLASSIFIGDASLARKIGLITHYWQSVTASQTCLPLRLKRHEQHKQPRNNEQRTAGIHRRRGLEIRKHGDNRLKQSTLKSQHNPQPSPMDTTRHSPP